MKVSSRRYKENIHDMNDYSEYIYRLRPVTFDYKDKHSPFKAAGLIAEEVEEVAPELVAYADNGVPMSVKYHELPALLLNEIQKLRKEVDELKKRPKKVSK